MLHLACFKPDKEEIGYFNFLNEVGEYRRSIVNWKLEMRFRNLFFLHSVVNEAVLKKTLDENDIQRKHAKFNIRQF
jgi:hypothetical protein